MLNTIGVDVIKLLKQVGVTGELRGDGFEEVLALCNASKCVGNSDYDVVYRSSDLAVMCHWSGLSRTITWRSYEYCWTTKLPYLSRKRYLMRYPHFYKHIRMSVTPDGRKYSRISSFHPVKLCRTECWRN